MKPQVYIDPRPAEYFDKYHERVRDAAAGLGVPRRADGPDAADPAASTATARSTSTNVPERGPVLLAPNHFSYLDHFFVAVLLRREVQFMAKSQLFQPPCSTSSSTTAARSRSAAGSATRRRSSPPTRSSTGAAWSLMYAEGGRSRTQGAGPAQAGPRPARARVGRAGRAGRDPRLGARAGGEARRHAEGDGPVRRAASASSRSTIRRREQSQEVAEQVFDRVRDDVRGAHEAGPPRRPRAAAPRAPRRRARHGLTPVADV